MIPEMILTSGPEIMEPRFFVTRRKDNKFKYVSQYSVVKINTKKINSTCGRHFVWCGGATEKRFEGGFKKSVKKIGRIVG